MPLPDEIVQILNHAPVPFVQRCEPVHGSGFSGGEIWRVTTPLEEYCLRRWPPGTMRERLEAIISVLSTGAPRKLVPIPLRQGSDLATIPGLMPQIVLHAGSFWTIEPWLPGEPLASFPPSRLLVQNALQAVAHFHQCVAAHRHPSFPARIGSAPGLQDRATLAARYLQHTAQFSRAPLGPDLHELGPRRDKLLPLFVEVAPLVLEQVRPALQWHIPLQICIRDIHAEHVLMTRDEVTGLIDFDAMQVDCVATDLARLLGDYVRDDEELWEVGLNAYHEARPLSPQERELILHYDRLAVLLTGMQWLDWILLAGKEFELSRVLPRIDATLLRLEHLRDALRKGGLVW